MTLNAPEQPLSPTTGYWARPLRHPDVRLDPHPQTAVLSQHVIWLRALDARRRRLAGFWSWAGNDHTCNQKRVDCRTISFIIADCWRCIRARSSYPFDCFAHPAVDVR